VFPIAIGTLNRIIVGYAKLQLRIIHIW